MAPHTLLGCGCPPRRRQAQRGDEESKSAERHTPVKKTKRQKATIRWEARLPVLKEKKRNGNKYLIHTNTTS
eukprot:scaffold126207_cov27-Tisochrysis_lutea.AAC.2